jgi:hypothetical protein
MIMGGEDQKATALVGFTLGIEVAQLIVISITLGLSALLALTLRDKRPIAVRLISAAIHLALKILHCS